MTTRLTPQFLLILRSPGSSDRLARWPKAPPRDTLDFWTLDRLGSSRPKAHRLRGFTEFEGTPRRGSRAALKTSNFLAPTKPFTALTFGSLGCETAMKKVGVAVAPAFFASAT